MAAVAFKVRIPQRDASQRVSLVERFVGNPSTMPAVAGVQLEATPEGLVLRATNLEEYVEVVVPGKVEGGGAVVVPAGVLSQLIATARGGEYLDLQAEKGVVRVEGDQGVAKIRTLEGGDFPPPPTLTHPHRTVVDTAALSSSLEAVVPAVATSTIKPELTGVAVRMNGRMFVVVATDSFRLAEKRFVEEDREEQGERTVIIPRRSVTSVLRVVQGSEVAALHADERQLEVSSGTIRYVCRLIDGTFPDYEKIIPTTFATTVRMERDAITHALKRAHIFTDSLAYVRLSVDPQKKTITLRAQSPQVGEIEEVVEGDVHGEAQDIGFNLRYLQEGVAPIRSHEVVWQFVGEGKPLVMAGAAEEGYRYLVMPMNR